MTQEDRWQRWLHDRHAMPTLARWACGLRAFRFCRAVGGHSGIDGDLFLAGLRYRSLGDLLGLLDALGIAPVRVPADTPQPLVGQPYPGDVFATFPLLVTEHPTVVQPGHVRLAGAAAYIWAGADRVEIHVADEDDVYEVTEAAFEAAWRIEALLAPLAGRVVDPASDK